MVHFDHSALDRLMTAVLRDKGVNESSVRHVVSSLIQTSLRGVDSHGINLFPHYCKEVDSGRINKNPHFKFEKTAAATAVMDADHGFGHHAGAAAIDSAIDYALQSGMGSVSVKNSSHFGAAAYFGLRAAEKDCLGFAFTNADALVKAHGSSEPFFGTNPICFCAPMKDEDPFCLDMATSLVSWNKINNCRMNNQPIPPHWAFDEQGNSVTDPHKAISLNPAGEYKGFGLGAVVDILCALLANGPLSRDIIPMYTSAIADKRYINHFFMVIDIRKFTDVNVFKSRLQEMVNGIRNLKPLSSATKVMAAGDPEKKSSGQRLNEGIPVSDVKFADFLSVSEQFRSAAK